MNSDIVLPSIVSLERLSPKGSYHLDENRYEGHTCSEIAYRIIDVERIVRAKSPQLNLTGKNWMTQRDIQCEVCFLRPCSKDQLVLMQLSLE